MINNIILAIQANQVIISRHAKEEAEADSLKVDEIFISQPNLQDRRSH